MYGLRLKSHGKVRTLKCLLDAILGFVSQTSERRGAIGSILLSAPRVGRTTIGITAASRHDDYSHAPMRRRATLRQRPPRLHDQACDCGHMANHADRGWLWSVGV